MRNKLDHAIALAELWKYGKLIGGDAHAVSVMLVEEVARLRQALRDIADPIPAWQRDLQDGYTLDGAECVRMADDPETYRRMAREALND